jgi:hypothetical protein
MSDIRLLILSQGVRQRLAEEAVRVIVVDPFENNERARQLVSQSARYRSGYWVVKMFVWRFEEYIKMVYGKDSSTLSYTRHFFLVYFPCSLSTVCVFLFIFPGPYIKWTLTCTCAKTRTAYSAHRRIKRTTL